MPEIKARLDGQAPDTVAPGYMSTIMSWREGAWRNAERLRMAENDPVELALVKQSIEDAATSAAVTLMASGLYGPLGAAERTARNDWCAAHRWG